MKIHKHLIILLVIFTNSSHSQNWIERGNPFNDQLINDVIQVNDSSYVFAGKIYDQNNEYNAAYGMMDKLGNINWVKTIGGNNDDEFKKVYKVTEQGIDYLIFVGISASFKQYPLGYPGDAYLVKTDMNGDTVWTHFYDGMYFHAFNAVNDSLYILTGLALLTGIEPTKGDTLWNKGYMGWAPGMIGLQSQIQKVGSGYYTGVGAVPANYSKLMLMKLDSNFNVDWCKTYGDTSINYGFCMAPTLDGNFLLAGVTNQYLNAAQDYFIIKLNANGDTLWSKAIDYLNYAEQPNSILKLDSNNYLISGFSIDPLFPSNGAISMIIALDSNGNYKWAQEVSFGIGKLNKGKNNLYYSFSYGVVITDSAYNTCSTSIGGGLTIKDFPVNIFQMSVNAVPYNTFLHNFRTPSQFYNIPFNWIDYCIYLGEQENSLTDSFSIYPNPASNSFTINLNMPTENLTLSIFDVTGKRVVTASITSLEQTKDTSTLKNGLYLVKVNDGDGKINLSKKLVLIH